MHIVPLVGFLFLYAAYVGVVVFVFVVTMVEQQERVVSPVLFLVSMVPAVVLGAFLLPVVVRRLFLFLEARELVVTFDGAEAAIDIHGIRCHVGRENLVEVGRVRAGALLVKWRSRGASDCSKVNTYEFKWYVWGRRTFEELCERFEEIGF